MLNNTNKVYIADMATLIPELYPQQDVVETFYPKESVSDRCRTLVSRLVHGVGITNRPVAIDLELFPKIVLKSQDYSPVNWGSQIIDSLTKHIPLEQVGYISVSYNIAVNNDILPNLACQIALHKNLNLDFPPEELVSYGCAAGILSLKSAVEYCQRTQKAAIVYMFEHCTALAKPIYDVKNKDFKANLRSNVLFSDGAIGLLVLPECKVEYKEKCLEIVDIDTGFQLGDAILMRNGKFLVGNTVKDVMPSLVSEKSVLPLLQKNDLTVEQIDEWSIHQGGIPVLQKFTEPSVLGLPEEKILNSLNLFKQYGNFSTLSCFFVLNSFFNQPIIKEKYGAIVSFGAGYYYGSALYRKGGC